MFKYLISRRNVKGLQLLLNVPSHQQLMITSATTTSGSPSIMLPQSPGLNINAGICDVTLIVMICKMWFSFSRALDTCPATNDDHDELGSFSSVGTIIGCERQQYDTHIRYVLQVAVVLSHIIDSIIDCIGLPSWNSLIGDTHESVAEAIIAHSWRFYSGNVHPQLLHELRRCLHLESVSLEFNGDDDNDA
jgi:hypothetical protein